MLGAGVGETMRLWRWKQQVGKDRARPQGMLWKGGAGRGGPSWPESQSMHLMFGETMELVCVLSQNSSVLRGCYPGVMGHSLALVWQVDRSEDVAELQWLGGGAPALHWVVWLSV